MRGSNNEPTGPGSKMSNSNQKADQYEKLRVRLQTEKDQFRKVIQKEKQTDFDSSPDMVYYIISTKFLNQWQEFTGFSDKNPSQPIGQGPEPSEMNADIIIKLKEETKLKLGLEQHSDFEIVSKEVMHIFKDYPGTRIQRKAVILDNRKKAVEIYKLQFQYFLLTKKVIQDLSRQMVPVLKIESADISRYARLGAFKTLALEIYRRNDPGAISSRSQENVRIWKLDSEVSVSKYASHLKKYSGNKVTQEGFNIPAKAIEYANNQQTVADFSIADDDTIIFEIKDYITGWILTKKQQQVQNSNHKMASCQYCRYCKPIKFSCQCGRVDYCSEECRYKDMRFHTRVCKYAEEVDTKEDIDMSFSPGSRKGLTGLQNLGNTCFMNSCLQCLSNTIPLTEYFLSKKFMSQINVKNPIGTKGKISMNYAKTIKGLWCDSSSTYSPYILKSSIAEFQPMFSGFSQHDSQEFLSFLLDGLHEDLNRVIVKPTTDTIESKGRSDEVVARESWVNYLKRNQSVVVDLFMGQYKSKVTCPTCQHQSITFDPYSTLSLPIPQGEVKTKSSISTFVFFANNRDGAKKLTVEYTGSSIKEWRTYTANQLNLKADQLAYYCLSFADDIEEFNDNTPIDYIKRVTSKKNNDLFCLQLTKEDLQVLENSRKYCVFKFINAQISNQTVFTFNRPMYFDLSKAVGLDVYWRVYRFLYKYAIAKETRSGYSFGWSSSSTSYSEPDYEEFKKTFLSKGKLPFEIYVKPKSDKQSLLKYQEPIGQYIAENGVQFHVRVMNSSAEELKKFINYDDADKNKSSSDHYSYDDKQYSLGECFSEFQKPQKLQEGNQWYCPKCKEHKQAMKQMELYKTPKILVIHLKRFKQKSDRWFATKSKNGCLIKFPHELDMGEFTISHTLPQAYFARGQDQEPLVKPQQVNDRQCSRYELYAVSNHFGTMSGGHYTAYAKNNDSWYNFNDSSVHKVGSNEVVSRDAYMLFYRRVDIRRTEV